MNILVRGEFLLLVLAGALFTLAALHFTGHIDTHDYYNRVNDYISGR